MSERPNDLTEGWPPDSENPELARFAEELSRSLLQLPAESLERVGERVRGEVAKIPHRRRPWLLAGAAAAAILLLALGWGVSGLWSRRPTDVASGDGVTDFIRVDLARPPGAVSPTRPLVDLDENQSLFTD